MLFQKIFLKTLQNSQKNIFAGVSFSIKLQATNLKLSETATGNDLWKKVYLKMSQISPENKTPVLESLFNKVAVLRACNVIKKIRTQELSCKICEVFKNNYFEEHLWTTTVYSLYSKRDSDTGAFRCILRIIQQSLFNKVARLTAQWPLTVLERDSSTGTSLWIFWILGKNFCSTASTNHFSNGVAFFSFLQINKVWC